MSRMNAFQAVDQYARLGLRTDVETATPHRLILLLLDGAVDKLRLARMAMEQGRVADKGTNLSWAISIIDGLRASLDTDRGGELALNLDRLYDYMTRTLVTANLDNDAAKVDEVTGLLGEIRAGWKGIERQVDGTGQRPAVNEIGPNAVATS
ncbi:MAG: flagellar export chaperone FliS [Gammaproteobacteria bacterium]